MLNLRKKQSKIIQWFCICAISLFFSSCISFIAKQTGLHDKTPVFERLNVPEKEVYFLGMMHLAKSEYYEAAKKILDTFNKQGYVFYVESVSENTTDSTVKVELDSIRMKKIRKIIRLDLGKYSETDNEILKKLIQKFNLVDQPHYRNMGIKNYRRVDLSYVQLIDMYEKKYGPVILDSCDLATALKTSYNCNPLPARTRKIFTDEFIVAERNKLIAEAALSSNDKKIVIIYGKKHLEGIREEINNAKK